MSKQLKVCANLQQNFTDAEKQTARNNIGAMARSDLPDNLLYFDAVIETNSQAIQVWGNDQTSSLGTYKNVGSINIPARRFADVTLSGTLQYALHGQYVNALVFQVSEQDSIDNNAVNQPVYIRDYSNSGIIYEVPVSIRFLLQNTSSSTKTYYFGAYNLGSVATGDLIKLANNITNDQGLRISVLAYGVDRIITSDAGG